MFFYKGSKIFFILFLIMRFLIIQPSWDHSEILCSLLYFIKKGNHKVKIIYDWTHPEGNYLDYFCSLNGFGDDVKINYKSPKHHIKDFQNSHKIIFVDEIHLKKFFNKNIFNKFKNKIYTFNHLTKDVPYDIKVICLGIIPYNRCINANKFLIGPIFDPGNDKIKKNMNNKKKYLIVGNPNYRKLIFLEKLPSEIIDNIEINFVVRKPLDKKLHKNINILTNVSTDKLIELIIQTDYVITLFKNDSVYHKDRISGIVPLAFSFGKPLIMDRKYSGFNKLYRFNKITYKNSFTYFKNVLLESMNLSNFDYINCVEDTIQYRDIQITEQYLNFNLVFN